MSAIGILTLELHLELAHSLKDKRSVVKGLKDRLRSKFNVSVAETAYHETWQRSQVTVVTVSNERLHVEQSLQAVEAEAEAVLGGMLVGADPEVLESQAGGWE